MKHPDLLTLDALDGFEVIIDVRTPDEFALDHIPGAINYPVLSNEERIEVGTLYKQASPFEAKKVGAARVSRNIALYLERDFLQHGKGWRPLVYCWRGGSRSGAMTHILRQVGWPAAQLQGGYKAFRAGVVQALDELPGQFEFHVVCGETGSAKSRLLHAIAQAGGQVLDLEAIACHKGSVLGLLPNAPQPTQKMFETQLWQALRHLDPAKPVFIEAESRKIGKLRLPAKLFEQMSGTANIIQVKATVPARVEFLIRDYNYFLQDPVQLKAQLAYLKDLHGQAVLDNWNSLIDQHAWPELVEDLLCRHYDPAYRKSTPHYLKNLPDARVMECQHLDEQGLQVAARHIIEDTPGAVQG